MQRIGIDIINERFDVEFVEQSDDFEEEQETAHDEDVGNARGHRNADDIPHRLEMESTGAINLVLPANGGQ